MKLKHAILSLALCLGVTGMQAQEKNYEPYPYVFVGVQGGGQMTLTNYDHMKLFTPLAGVNFGTMFSPVVGLRLGAQGIWNKTAAKAAFGPYNKADFKYVTGDLDLLVNLSNAIFPGKTHTFNTFLVVGAGLAYAWDFKPEDGMTATTLKEFEWQRDRLTHNIRVGLAEEVNICKNLAVNLEVDLNNLHDRFNAKRNWNNDWQLTAMLGLNFKFGFKSIQPQDAISVPAVPLSLYDQMQAGVNTRMNTWMKRLKGESKADYLSRTNDAAIVAQRLSYTKAIATDLAGNLINTSLKGLAYNKNIESLGVSFEDMPTITLKVPVSEIKYIKGKEDLQFTNTVYNLNPGDKFEVLYTDAVTPQGQKYTYVKTAEAQFVDMENYVPLDVYHQDMVNKTRLQAIATDAVREAKEKNYLTDNTIITVSTELLPTGNGKTDYRVSYKYTVKDAFSVQDDFAPGKYDADQAAATTAMLNIINKSLNEDFAKYVEAGKAVEIRYTGSADAKPIHGRIAYNGMYGDIKAQPVNVNGQQENITVTRATGITSNEQLSLIRAISVQNSIKKNVPALKNMKVTESFNVEVSPNEGSQFRRVAVDFLFRDTTLK